jgi:signal peptidase I
MVRGITKSSIIFSGDILESTQLEPQFEPQLEPHTQPEAQPEVQPEHTDDWKRFGLDILETIVLAVVLYFGINALSARVRVDGFSMIPTLQNGEYILVNRLAYKTGQPARGDIIVFSLPADNGQDLIKRVIGLPGETVHVSDGSVTINGVKLEETYIAQDPLYFGDWTVPEGHLFVLGDNRNDSRDSHQWGLLPLENVIGKSVLIYWPQSEWQIINHTEEVFITPEQGN